MSSPASHLLPTPSTCTHMTNCYQPKLLTLFITFSLLIVLISFYSLQAIKYNGMSETDQSLQPHEYLKMLSEYSINSLCQIQSYAVHYFYQLCHVVSNSSYSMIQTVIFRYGQIIPYGRQIVGVFAHLLGLLFFRITAFKLCSASFFLAFSAPAMLTLSFPTIESVPHLLALEEQVEKLWIKPLFYNRFLTDVIQKMILFGFNIAEQMGLSDNELKILISIQIALLLIFSMLFLFILFKVAITLFPFLKLLAILSVKLIAGILYFPIAAFLWLKEQWPGLFSEKQREFEEYDDLVEEKKIFAVNFYATEDEYKIAGRENTLKSLQDLRNHLKTGSNYADIASKVQSKHLSDFVKSEYSGVPYYSYYEVAEDSVNGQSVEPTGSSSTPGFYVPCLVK